MIANIRTNNSGGAFVVRLLMHTRHFPWALLGCLLVSSVSALVADDRVDYLKQIKPMLTRRCVACHGALKQEGGLRLDTAALAIKGGESGAAIKPGDAAASLLLKRVTATEESERMPPEGEPLKPEQIAALRELDRSEGGSPSGRTAGTTTRATIGHSRLRCDRRFRRSISRRPSKLRWQRNPIDAFIARRASPARNLVPQSEADQASLVAARVARFDRSAADAGRTGCIRRGSIARGS